MTDVAVREAVRDDVPLILALIRELADYEHLAGEVVATAPRLEEHLFGAQPVAHALVAESENGPAGFALYFFNYSTFLARPGLYLEDLYVRPAARGRGIGRALLAALAARAVARDCGRMEWAVLDWNVDAIGFYEQLGARPQSQWTTYRLTGSAIAELAREAAVP
jgi:GNAT superfamily N-acetyltransferase